MRITIIIGVLCGIALAAPAAANGADLRIVLPPVPPPEDVDFPLHVEGAIDAGAPGVRVIAKARPTAGLQCAPSPSADSGERVLDDAIGATRFRLTGAFAAASPGDHIVCAWLVSGAGEVLFGPVSSTVAVRGPGLNLRLDVPRTIRPGRLFDIRIESYAEAPRTLVVFLARGTSCDVQLDPIEVFPDPVVYDDVVSLNIAPGDGFLNGSVLPERWGQHILCGFLRDRDPGASGPSEFADSQLVRVGGPRRRCPAVGGLRGIARVAVGGISCTRGRSVARRWGAARRAPRAISGLGCERRSGRRVRCAGYQGEVTFRYRR